MRSDGGNTETLPNTAIVKFLFPASLNVATLVPEISVFVIAEGLTSVQDYAGATIRSVVGATRAPVVTYGNVQTAPAGLVTGSFSSFQVGQPELLTYFAVNGLSLTNDLYFYRNDAAGLTRITNFVTGGGAASPARLPAAGTTKAPGRLRLPRLAR